MRIKKITLLSLMITFLCLGGYSMKPQQKQFKSQTSSKTDLYRGFEITADLTDQDFKDLKSYGANIIRVMFSDNKLISKSPPYEYNEVEFKKLDRMIMLCATYDLKIVIDPHTFPGIKDDYTTHFKDEFWSNKELQDKFVEMWKKISDRYKNNVDVIFGYDILNEPSVTNPEIWFDLVNRVTKVIRDNGDKNAIIVEAYSLFNDKGYSPRNNTLENLKLPDDDNIIMSTHFYEPHEYTHQLVISGYDEMTYDKPTKAIVQKDIDLIRAYQLQHPEIPIYIGEFSVSRIAGDSNEYLKDLIDACEKYGWHWTYHAFRESYYWDSEMPNGTLNILPRTSDSPRIQLLKSYFNKNK